jgi:hypothetical protein
MLYTIPNSYDFMNRMSQNEKCFKTSHIVLTTLGVLIVTLGISLSGLPLLNASAQNQTAATNQTVAPTPTNTTRGDFNAVRENINSAREALFNNDTDISYGFIGTAGNEIFDLTRITEDEVASDEPSINQTMIEKLKAVEENLNNAQSSLRNNDNSKALQDINSADAELLVVTKDLPP